MWVIKNLEYPYRHCGFLGVIAEDCEAPKIKYVGIFFDDYVDAETKLKMLEIVEYLAQRGEPIDAYGSDGYTALQLSLIHI